MTKFLTRLVADKFTCQIEMEIINLTVHVQQPIVMMVCWTRGPQRDESNKFEVTPDKTQYEIKHTFSRASSFFREKNCIQKKTCTIELVSSALEKRVVVGSIEMDLAPMVGKGRTIQTLDLENISIAKSARITAAFTLTELGKGEAEKFNNMLSPNVAAGKNMSGAFGG